MTFMEDHPEWYGTYSDYHPEITRYKTNQELEEEIEQLRSEVTTLKRCLGELKRTVEYENTQAELLEAQLAIGKAVIESMLELIPKKGTEKTIVPVTIEDNEFEIEVRMK